MSPVQQQECTQEAEEAGMEIRQRSNLPSLAAAMWTKHLARQLGNHVATVALCFQDVACINSHATQSQYARFIDSPLAGGAGVCRPARASAGDCSAAEGASKPDSREDGEGAAGLGAAWPFMPKSRPANMPPEAAAAASAGAAAAGEGAPPSPSRSPAVCQHSGSRFHC